MSGFAEPEKVVLLALESDGHPMHLGVLQVFAPPAEQAPDYPGRPLKRCGPAPTWIRTFTGHPSMTRRGTSKVRWTYDTRIDIDYHWRYRDCPRLAAKSNFSRRWANCTAAYSIDTGPCGRGI